MKLIRTNLKDCFIIENSVFEDERGYFFEGFNQEKLEDLSGISFEPKQLNQSKSGYGVLRGLHFQLPAKSQAKLISCIEGEVLDVAVDLRKESESYKQYEAVKLNEKNKKSLFVPKGMAHGFLSLSKTAKLMYLVDEFYSPRHDYGIIYNDADINVDWGIDSEKIILSKKDSQLPTLKDIKLDF
ncbi:MAG: dTDP-4-dehydrorhamnose 3,5-epimerase [Ekhidna sp.]|nr:dTDP-4-dehydrorhamnose 3,5-epimerase [Ekhidna sp.]MBC6409688.1 dTDP-4-dehydrorhamnose 3,5-epimerase [Ekhidna sp.]MBC6427466.1 dTDP-4-dehydrorhamnose 3,5-epimerase [Ekhidna sp.]